MTQEQKDLLDNWEFEFKQRWDKKDYRQCKNIFKIFLESVREDQKEKDIRIVADHFSICGKEFSFKNGEYISKNNHTCQEHEMILMNLIQNQ